MAVKKNQPRLGSPAFKALQAKWYDKLATKGFEDIEERNSPREMLKCWHNTWFQARGTPDQIAKQAQYYQMATDMLNTYEFATKLDRKIWELHANGNSVREIAKIVKLAKSPVHLRIQRVKAAMLGLT